MYQLMKDYVQMETFKELAVADIHSAIEQAKVDIKGYDISIKRGEETTVRQIAEVTEMFYAGGLSIVESNVSNSAEVKDINKKFLEAQKNVPEGESLYFVYQKKKGKPTKKMQRSAKPRIILCTPIPAYKPSWNISDSVIVNHIIPIINKVAKEENLEVIDLHTIFNNADGKAMQADGIHPTEAGDGQIARAVKDGVKN
jgi:hypothetical protein